MSAATAKPDYEAYNATLNARGIAAKSQLTEKRFRDTLDTLAAEKGLAVDIVIMVLSTDCAKGGASSKRLKDASIYWPAATEDGDGVVEPAHEVYRAFFDEKATIYVSRVGKKLLRDIMYAYSRMKDGEKEENLMNVCSFMEPAAIAHQFGAEAQSRSAAVLKEAGGDTGLDMRDYY